MRKTLLVACCSHVGVVKPDGNGRCQCGYAEAFASAAPPLHQRSRPESTTETGDFVVAGTGPRNRRARVIANRDAVHDSCVSTWPIGTEMRKKPRFLHGIDLVAVRSTFTRCSSTCVMHQKIY
jgi:hypothetical protein